MDTYFFTKIKPQYYDSIKQYRNEMLSVNSDFAGCSNLEKYEDVEKWKLNCDLFESNDTVPPGYSIGFEYMYVKDDEVIGMVNMRPEALDHPYLKQYGGHIGYSIRPSKRLQGIGTRMLKEFLVLCKNTYNLNKVLITCFKDNIGSRKIIIRNGGIFENEVLYPPTDSLLERYWVSL